MMEHHQSADIARTRAYAAKLEVCQCANCRNYVTAAPVHLPELADYLARFGADIARPEEVIGSVRDGRMACTAWYTVCCTEPVRPCTQYVGTGPRTLRVDVSNDCGVPHGHERDDRFFALAVMGIELPWVLDEPPNVPVSLRNRGKRKGRT